MENTLAFIVPDNRKLVAGIFDPSFIKHRHILTEIWAVAFVAKACLSPKPYSRPQMADILAALQYIKSSKFTIYGNLQPTGHLGCPALAIAKILDGPEILGRISRPTANMTSSSSSTASRNLGFIEARGLEETYPHEEILASSNIITLSFLEIMDATRDIRIDTAVEEDEAGRVFQAGSGPLLDVRRLYY